MKKQIKYTIILAVLYAALYSSQSMLVLDNNSFVVSSGKGYDLFDTRSPFVRTYSSLLSYKDKLEVSFHHNDLPEDVALENISLGLKKNMLRIFRTGAYFTFLNMGFFKERDSYGIESLAATFKSQSFLIGIPLVIDFNSLNPYRRAAAKAGDMDDEGDTEEVKGEGKEGLVKFLKAVNAGINLNFFRSSLEDSTAGSFLADINLVARFKTGYIGMPKSLITAADIEGEQQDLISKYELKYKKETESIQGNEKMEQELKDSKLNQLTGNRDKYNEKIGKIYAKKIKDIKNVELQRQAMYAIYNNPLAELDASKMSNIFKTGLAETRELVAIASNTIMENHNYLLDILVTDSRNNQDDIKYYGDKFRNKCQDEQLKAAAEELSKLYMNYVLDLYKKEVIENLEVELARREYAIAEKRRKGNLSAKDARALADEKDSVQKKKRSLKRMKAEYEEKYREYDLYITQKDDTWKSIALDKFNDEKLANKIRDYNRSGNKDIELEPGMTIRIPKLDTEQKRQEIINKFKTDKAEIEARLKGFDMDVLESLYFKSVISKVNKRTDFFVYKKQLDSLVAGKINDLNNLLRSQENAFVRSESDLQKKLKRIKLKKEFDISGDITKKDITEALREYKREERKIFRSMLLQIFRSKKKMLKKFMDEEAKKRKYQLDNLKAIAVEKTARLDENRFIQVTEAGDDKEKITAIKNEFSAQQAEEESAYALQLEEITENYTTKINELEWQLYTTHLVYLSSDEKPDAMALGFSVRNLGVPIKYDTVKENAPIAISADFNYQYLNLSRHLSRLYLHYNYSAIESNVVGGGLMYRFAGFFELRAGVSMIKSELQPAANLGLLFNVGMMQYRFDAGVLYQPLFGPAVNAGLTVRF